MIVTDDNSDEEGADVEEEDKQLQEGPEDKDQAFKETKTGIPSREAEDRGVYRLEPTIGGGGVMRPRLAHSFSESRDPKERDGLTSTKMQQ